MRAWSALAPPLVSPTLPPLPRPRSLADLYNILPNGSTEKFDTLLAVIALASASQQVDVITPFLGDIPAYAAKHALSKTQTRTLLHVVADALDGAGQGDAAQQYRIQYLGTFQGEAPEVLAEAQEEAVAAALGYFKAPVVSQKSNLPTLDAVSARPSAPAPLCAR